MLNLAIAALLLAPQGAPAQTADAAASQPAAKVLESLFPAPSGTMTLVAGDSDNTLTYASLVKQYGSLTGQFFVVGEDTQAMLRQTLNLDRTMTVPAEEVQSVFEQLLKHGDFVLNPLTTSGTRIVELTSLATSARNSLRSRAIFLAPDELHLAGQHPALLFTTTVTLPNLDVRQVSNSLRTMITDANTQQMLPAGNSNSMIIVGFGDQVAGMIQTLKSMDDAASSGAVKNKQVLEVVRLTNGQAADVAAVLTDAYLKPEGAPGFSTSKFIADTRSNSILVTARAGDLKPIKALIAALDVE